MKMANISFKEYTIQAIVNPGTFYATECGKETQNEAKLYVLQKDIKKFKHFEEISIGQIVAVKHESRYHRGLITDHYNRQLKPIYCVWLVDIGNNIEISIDSLFMIKNPELKNKKLNAFEIVVYGIQPVTVELLVGSVDFDDNINKSNLDGILHRRESRSWSPAAFKFIRNLFETNKCIYVNCVEMNGSKITGEVYYKQEGVGLLTSLAQTLCDKDFAVFSESATKIAPLENYQGNKYLGSVERKIPNIPKNVEWEELSAINSQYRGTKKKFDSGNLCSSSGSDKSSCSGSDKLLISKDRTNSLETGNFSPSWILKKVDQCTPSTSSGSFKSSHQNIEQTEKTVSSPKVSLLRIVQRNVQLYDKHK